MREFDRRDIALEEPPKRRSAGSLLGDLGDRLARTFSKVDATDSSREVNGDLDTSLDDQRTLYRDRALPRFQITRRGYDCAAVDAQVAELEAELAELEGELAGLRVRPPSRNEVAAEIERIGVQTSAILLEAHDRAQETTRLAQAQAAGSIADAASYAVALTEEANFQLRQVEADQASISREHMRLIEDIRGTAIALFSLADRGAGRFDPEHEQASPTAASRAEPSTGRPPAVSALDEAPEP